MESDQIKEAHKHKSPLKAASPLRSKAIKKFYIPMVNYEMDLGKTTPLDITSIQLNGHLNAV